MRRELFLKITSKLEETDIYFTRRPNAARKLSMSVIQKFTAAIRMLAYGCSAYSLDEYTYMGESTMIECLNHFVDDVLANFVKEYLRKPNREYLARLLRVGEERGFSSMLGSIDCMHWEWKNCPTAWVGQFTGRSGHSSIVLEAVASYDTWIWHTFFGVPGSSNDVNVLDRSPILDDLYSGKNNFTVNGHEYDTGYYLADDIFLDYPTFVKVVRSPVDNKFKLFTKVQESYRKDVERTFGILQAQFAIVRGPTRFWDQTFLSKITRCCIVMHDMIVEQYDCGG